MAEGLPLGLSLVAGLGLGLFYFGGLWLTVKQLRTAKRTSLLLLASSSARIAVALVGFYLVAGGQLERLILCLLGFFAVRILITRHLRPERADQTEVTR